MWPSLVACLRRVAEREAALPPEGTPAPAAAPGGGGEGAGGAHDTEGPAVGGAASVSSAAGGAVPADVVSDATAASVTVPAAGSTSTLSAAGVVSASPATPHPHSYGRPPPPSTLSSETLRSEDGRRWWYVDHMSNAKGRYVKLTEAVPVRVSVYVPASGFKRFFFDVEARSAAGDTFLRLSEVTRHGRSKLVLPVSTWKPMRDILDVYIRHAERQGLFE
ncbi:hypothetical protein I4F81_000428 [Pyropia yezoensis]|uniref:Uncharacterized protein n=1 Tax=Pyropia yezoensis TaxID=2788 RepID=A0ACC3BJ77_PYRYE|nr:hypothetical protein I4F81_000428 [Neopyropia yezoensis]